MSACESEGGRFRIGSGATLCGEFLFGVDEVEEGTASCVEAPSIGAQEASSEKGGALKDDGVSKNPAESRETKWLAQRRRKKERQRAKKLAARGGKKEAEPTKDVESQQEVEMALQRAIDVVVSSQLASQQVQVTTKTTPGYRY